MSRKIAYAGIAVIMTVAIILLIPVGVFREEWVSHNGAEAGSTVALEEGNRVSQYFAPVYDYIRSISVAIDRKKETVTEGALHFILYDEDGKILCERECAISEFSDGGFFKISVGCAVKTDKMYMWEVFVTGAGDAVPGLVCTAPGNISPQENQRLLVETDETESAALAMYTYGVRQGKLAAVNYLAFVFCMGVIAGTFVKQAGAGKQSEDEKGLWAA